MRNTSWLIIVKHLIYFSETHSSCYAPVNVNIQPLLPTPFPEDSVKNPLHHLHLCARIPTILLPKGCRSL